jgi:hypothetical protein
VRDRIDEPHAPLGIREGELIVKTCQGCLDPFDRVHGSPALFSQVGAQQPQDDKQDQERNDFAVIFRGLGQGEEPELDRQGGRRQSRCQQSGFQAAFQRAEDDGCSEESEWNP